MKTKIGCVLIGLAAMVTVGCNNDEDKETVDADLALTLADSWVPVRFSFNPHVENPEYDTVCDAPSAYSNVTYKAGLEIASQAMVLGDKDAAILTPSCSSDPAVNYTWQALTVSNGWQLKLVSGGQTIRFQVKSYGGDDLELYPVGYNLPETFIMQYRRAQ